MVGVLGDWSLSIADFGLRIVDFKNDSPPKGCRKLKFSIPIPQSEID